MTINWKYTHLRPMDCLAADEDVTTLLTENARLRERVASLGRDLNAIAIAGDERIRQRDDRIAELERALAERERTLALTDKQRVEAERERGEARQTNAQVTQAWYAARAERDAATADATRLRAALEQTESFYRQRAQGDDRILYRLIDGLYAMDWTACPDAAQLFDTLPRGMRDAAKARAALAGSDDV